MTMQSDEAILSALRQNAEQGFRLLMARYQVPVYWHIRRLVVSHDDAQDASQETFVRVFRSFQQYKPTCSFSAWIFQIATHEALRILERRHNEQLSLDDSEAEVSQLMAEEYVDYQDLEAVKLQQAILSLPTKQQLAFNLRYYDEMDYEEIASIIGSTAANVKANYHIAKEKIKSFIHASM